MKNVRAFTLLLMLCSAMLAITPTRATQPILILNVSPQASSIQTDGTYVIWTEPVSDAFDAPRNLYATSLAAGNRITVATNITSLASHGAGIGTVAISNGVVVWIEGNTIERHLRAKNLRTDQVTTVAKGEVAFPAIVGNIVTWWENYYVDSTESAQQPATLKSRDLMQ